MNWFRFYHDTVFNAKAQSLPPTLFKHWVNLVCLCSRNDPRGQLPDLDKIAFALRTKNTGAQAILDDLTERGFFDQDPSGFLLAHDWGTFQFASDNSAPRVRKHRTKDLNENVTLPKKSETPSDTDTDTDTEKKGKGTPPAAKKRAGRVDLAANSFSVSYSLKIGNPYGWHSGDFTQLAKLRKRLSIGTSETPNFWEEAIENYFASPFSEFSLQHLASKFDTFKNSSLDRFKVPTNHVNGGNGNGHRKETDAEKNKHAGQDFITRSVAAEVCPDISDVREDPAGFPRPLQRIP